MGADLSLPLGCLVPAQDPWGWVPCGSTGAPYCFKWALKHMGWVWPLAARRLWRKAFCPSLLVHVTILWLCELFGSPLATSGLELGPFYVGIWLVEVRLRLLSVFLAGGQW